MLRKRTFIGFMAVALGLLALSTMLLLGQIPPIQESGQGQQPETRYIRINDAEQVLRLFHISQGAIVYCYSDGSKTTGFIVSKWDGEGCWILTAGHKVDKDFPQAGKILVKFSRHEDRKIEDKVYESIKIINPPKGWDLLLLKIPYKPKVWFDHFRNPHLFEKNWIFGYRKHIDLSPTGPGYVAYNTYSPKMFITTARCAPGNSGSPVLNIKGEVLGIVIAKFDSGDTLFVPGLVAKLYIESTLAAEKEEKKTKKEKK